MNIEAYDADSLRKMVRLLEYENKILKDKLKKAGISYEEVNPFEEKIESVKSGNIRRVTGIAGSNNASFQIV